MPTGRVLTEGLHEIKVAKYGICKLFSCYYTCCSVTYVDVREAMGPDGVSGWVLRECGDPNEWKSQYPSIMETELRH